MDDEKEQQEHVTEPETEGNEESPEEETARLNERVRALETALTERDAEISVLKQTGRELEERCTSLGTSLSGAVSGYRSMVVKTNPEIFEEMVSGDTIEAVNESLEKARALVSRVRQGMEAEITRMKVPAGAPERTAPDLSALSPGEKIRYALGGNE